MSVLLQYTGTAQGGGGTNLTHGVAFTVTGAGFGSKTASTNKFFDTGQAGNNVLGNNWSGALPNNNPNALYNTKNRSTPFSGHGGTTMSPAHSRTNVIIAGCHQQTDGSGNNVIPYVSYTRPTSVGTPYYSIWAYYQRSDPAWTFNLQIPADNNYKVWDYAKDAPYSPIAANWYDSSTNCTTNTDYMQHAINDDGAGSADQSLNFPDQNGHLGYWNEAINPFNPGAGWIKSIMVFRWNSDNTGRMQTYEVDRTNYLGGGAGVKLMIDYLGRTDGLQGTARSEGLGGYTRNYGVATNWRYFHDVYYDRDPSNDGFWCLTNNATFASSTIVEPQPYTAWADGSVTLTANGGLLTAGLVHLHYRSVVNGHQYKGSRTLN